MITWIILFILVVWCVYKRTREDGEVKGFPLGLPRGTIRAIVTLLIVSLPLQFLIMRQNVPGIVVNALFIVVAFYFEARKPGEDRLKRIIKEIKNPEKQHLEEKRVKKPLYWPKYTVRVTLILLLGLIILITTASGKISAFETTSTIIDVILIIGLYMVGSIFRGVGVHKERKKLKKQIAEMKDFQNLSKFQIIENLMVEKLSWWERKGKFFLSIFVLISMILSLYFYTFNIPIPLIETPDYTLSLEGMLLLVISLYYGIRD
ncbi:MAG: hypothetical protein ACFFAS_11530 [Promethearchaeota archaeon]